MVKETPYKAIPGIPTFVLWFAALVANVVMFVRGIQAEAVPQVVTSVVVGLALVE